MNYKEFLRQSIERNDEEVRELFLKERQEEMQEKIKALSNRNGIPQKFKNSTFDNYDPSDNLIAFNKTKQFVEDFPNSKSLLLTGPVGTGKTHLVAAVINSLNKKLYSTYFGNIVDIISFIRSTYTKDSTLSEDEAISIITTQVDLIVIDDLGKENSSENTFYLLYQLINKIYENEKSVIITTNFNGQQLEGKLGERGKAIVSRITEMCEPVILKGKDRRIIS